MAGKAVIVSFQIAVVQKLFFNDAETYGALDFALRIAVGPDQWPHTSEIHVQSAFDAERAVCLSVIEEQLLH